SSPTPRTSRPRTTSPVVSGDVVPTRPTRPTRPMGPTGRPDERPTGRCPSAALVRPGSYLAGHGRDCRGTRRRSCPQDSGRMTTPHASMASPTTAHPTTTHPAAAPSAAGHPVPVLSARGLVHSYGQDNAATRALDCVDLDIARADSLAVMGPSGCGKTTLLHVLAGILAPIFGTVQLDGQDLASLGDRRRTLLRRSRFGFVFQDGQLLPELTALENVILPRMLGGTSRRAATAEARAWLDR